MPCSVFLEVLFVIDLVTWVFYLPGGVIGESHHLSHCPLIQTEALLTEATLKTMKTWTAAKSNTGHKGSMIFLEDPESWEYSFHMVPFTQTNGRLRGFLKLFSFGFFVCSKINVCGPLKRSSPAGTFASLPTRMKTKNIQRRKHQPEHLWFLAVKRFCWAEVLAPKILVTDQLGRKTIKSHKYLANSPRGKKSDRNLSKWIWYPIIKTHTTTVCHNQKLVLKHQKSSGCLGCSSESLTTSSVSPPKNPSFPCSEARPGHWGRKVITLNAQLTTSAPLWGMYTVQPPNSWDHVRYVFFGPGQESVGVFLGQVGPCWWYPLAFVGQYAPKGMQMFPSDFRNYHGLIV